MPESDISGYLIIVAILIFGLFVAADVIFKKVGDFSVKSVKENYVALKPCNAERFVEDYGKYTTQGTISNDGQLYTFIKFDNNWLVVTESNANDCYFVSNLEKSKTIFKEGYFSNGIAKIDSNFYHGFVQCDRSSAGAQNACNVAGTISNVLGSPAIELVANIPQESFESIKNSFESEGWGKAIDYGGDTVKFVKYIQGSTALSVSVELTKVTSCALTDARYLETFNISNNINQTFHDAKNGIYKTEAVDNIIGSNELLSALELLKEKNPNYGKESVSFVSNLFTNETNCNEFKPKEKLASFYSNISSADSNANAANNAFQETLTKHMENAQAQIQKEKEEKAAYQPGWGAFFITPSKFIMYQLSFSKVNDYFNKQEYVSAERISKEKMSYYGNYWKQTNILHYIFSVIVYGIFFIIAAIFAYFIFLHPKEPTYYTGGGNPL